MNRFGRRKLLKGLGAAGALSALPRSWALAQNPERITVTSYGGVWETAIRDTFARFSDEQIGPLAAALDVAEPEAWRRLVEGSCHDPAAVPDELPYLLALCYAQDWTVPCWRNTIEEMRDLAGFRRYRILERLSEIAVPTLVVWGRNDKGGVYEEAVSAVGRMPDATLVTIDDCGHLPMLEKPEGYNASVLRFLSGGRA